MRSVRYLTTDLVPLIFWGYLDKGNMLSFSLWQLAHSLHVSVLVPSFYHAPTRLRKNCCSCPRHLVGPYLQSWWNGPVATGMGMVRKFSSNHVVERGMMMMIMLKSCTVFHHRQGRKLHIYSFCCTKMRTCSSGKADISCIWKDSARA